VTTKTKEAEELQYFRRVSELYEKASPIIRYIAAPEFLKRGLLPVSPRSLVESNITLQMVLQAVKKLTKPQNKLLVSVERDFEIALSNCIKAAEASEKFIDLTDYHQEGVFFGQIINAAVLAHEYIESVHQKLTDFEQDSKSIKDESTIKFESWEKAVPHTQSSKVENNNIKVDGRLDRPNLVEKGLDMLGDVIILLCGKVQNLFALIVKKSNFKNTSIR
jgi:hypothetical protein